MIGLLLQLNMYRAQFHKLPVSELSGLCTYATHRITQLPTDWSHNGFWTYHPYTHMIENLSKDFSDDVVMSKWEASPTHNNNLLAPVRYVCIVSQYYQGHHFVVLEGKK